MNYTSYHATMLMTHRSQSTFAIYMWVLKYVRIWWGFSLCTFLQVSIWKYCWWKRGNAHGAMNQTAISLLGTKRFSWPKLRRPSSWAVTATGLQAHLDLAPLWTQLLHFHHSGHRPPNSLRLVAVRVRWGGGGCSMEKHAAGPSWDSLPCIQIQVTLEN